MPDRPDYRSRRPPRRKSWDDDLSGDASGGEEEDPNYQYPPSKQVPSRQLKSTGNPSERPQSLGAGWGKSETAEEKEARSKYNRKRLLRTFGGQAMCLLILFSLIGAFNWMATDYSGDYMGQNPGLRTCRLTITRRATTADATLSYGQTGALELDTSIDQPVPQPEKEMVLQFVTPEQFRFPGKPIWHATFRGRIQSGEAKGFISDESGTYKVVMDKNVLTSLFSQFQAHIPTVPSVPLPTFFDESKAKPVRSLEPTLHKLK